jgi:hypothetical protein
MKSVIVEQRESFQVLNSKVFTVFFVSWSLADKELLKAIRTTLYNLNSYLINSV